MAGRANKVISKDMWEHSLRECRVGKEDMNALIMNYLVVEGYKEAAEHFASESGTPAAVNLESIEDRMAVRNSLQRGDVQDAVERVNDLDPLLLETNPVIFFHLQQQRLIELIRENKIKEALEFAQEELPPLCEDNPEFLEELERTMVLLAFGDKANSPLGDLLNSSQRQKVASELNEAILMSQNKDKEPRLRTLLKTMFWAQQQLERKCTFPAVTDVCAGILEGAQTDQK